MPPHSVLLRKLDLSTEYNLRGFEIFWYKKTCTIVPIYCCWQGIVAAIWKPNLEALNATRYRVGRYIRVL